MFSFLLKRIVQPTAQQDMRQDLELAKPLYHIYFTIKLHHDFIRFLATKETTEYICVLMQNTISGESLQSCFANFVQLQLTFHSYISRTLY